VSAFGGVECEVEHAVVVGLAVHADQNARLCPKARSSA
jgi:hypothetical protein